MAGICFFFFFFFSFYFFKKIFHAFSCFFYLCFTFLFSRNKVKKKRKKKKHSYSKPACSCLEGPITRKQGIFIWSQFCGCATLPKVHSGTILFNILLANLALLTSSSSCRIFSDVAGDITISVDGESFLLHKVSFSLQSLSHSFCIF